MAFSTVLNSNFTPCLLTCLIYWSISFFRLNKDIFFNTIVFVIIFLNLMIPVRGLRSGHLGGISLWYIPYFSNLLDLKILNYSLLSTRLLLKLFVRKTMFLFERSLWWRISWAQLSIKEYKSYRFNNPNLNS